MRLELYVFDDIWCNSHCPMVFDVRPGQAAKQEKEGGRSTRRGQRGRGREEERGGGEGGG